MATTVTYSGVMRLAVELIGRFTVDTTGGRTAKTDQTINWSAAGGSDPTLAGFLAGTVSVAGATDLLLAHATDPFQGGGDAAYSDGFTVAGSKLKLLWIRNTHATGSLTVARKATNGLPVFDAASDAVTIQPGGIWMTYLPTGTAALTTGSNDGLTVTPSSGTVTAEVVVAYGP